MQHRGAYGHTPGDNPGHSEAATHDTELIAASLVEPARFAELFDRHFPAIHRYLRRRVGAELADDLAAETFTQAFARRRQYRAEHPDAAPWLSGIAGNLLRQHARAEQRRLRAYARIARDPDTHDLGDGVAERVTDLAGRRGVGVTIGSPDEEAAVPEQTVLIFDPVTGRLLGRRSVLTGEVPGWRLTPGTVMEESTFLGMSVVDSPPPAHSS